FESPFTDVFGLFAEREAQQNSLELEAASGPAGSAHGLRLALTEARVVRSAEGLTGTPEHSRRERSVWLAARYERPLFAGTLEAQAGVGYASAMAVRAERVQGAPSLVWRLGRGSRRLRLYGERVATPMWTDLAPSVE